MAHPAARHHGHEDAAQHLTAAVVRVLSLSHIGIGRPLTGLALGNFFGGKHFNISICLHGH